MPLAEAWPWYALPAWNSVDLADVVVHELLLVWDDDGLNQVSALRSLLLLPFWQHPCQNFVTILFVPLFFTWKWLEIIFLVPKWIRILRKDRRVLWDENLLVFLFMQQTRGQCLPQRELAPDSYNISKLLEESSQDLNLLTKTRTPFNGWVYLVLYFLVRFKNKKN